MTTSVRFQSLLLICFLMLCASLAPSASARSRSHRTVVVTKHCSVKRSRHSVVKHCRTRRTVRTHRVSSHSAPHAPAAPAAGAGASTGSCADAGLAPDASNLNRISAATLCLVNQQRAASGEGPLAPDGALSAAALGHTTDMVDANFFDHAGSNGASAAARLLASGFVPGGLSYALAENLAWGTGSLATPAAIVNGWMHSPEHRGNILNAVFTKSGIGVLASLPATLSSGSGAIYTQDFGALG